MLVVMDGRARGVNENLYLLGENVGKLGSGGEGVNLKLVTCLYSYCVRTMHRQSDRQKVPEYRHSKYIFSCFFVNIVNH